MQRAEPPPQALNVLLVGTDEDTKSCIRNQLLHPYYRITPHLTFNSALELSAKEKSDVDLVLSDVPLRAEEGYEFIKQVQRWRKNIPHVVIFEAGRLSHHEITKAYKLGACYILQKPLAVPSDEIRNLWKHVVRWRAQNEGSSLVSSQQESLERGNEFMNHGEEPFLKKQRMAWKEELDNLFVEVVNELGKDAVPRRILELMRSRRPLPFLTREQVGSHLQKHREKEKKERHRPRMNKANGRNVIAIPPPPRSDIKNHILAPPLVSSCSHHDMSHLHLLETSTTDSLPPPPLPQMQHHRYNQQTIAYQQQPQYEHYEQLACHPMQSNNFSAVTSPIGNGSNVNTTRPAMHQPDRITHARSNMPQQRQPQGSSTSFEGKESNMLNQQHIAPNQTSGMQQLDENPCSSSRIINKNQALGTSFGRSNMLLQPITQNLNSNTQQLDRTSNALYAPIRSSQDGMITPEATQADQFWAGLLSEPADVDTFPNAEGLSDEYQ